MKKNNFFGLTTHFLSEKNSKKFSKKITPRGSIILMLWEETPVMVPPQPYLTFASVFDIPWEEAYQACPAFGEIWKDTQISVTSWPEGIQIHQNKMYKDNKLCVLSILATSVFQHLRKDSGHLAPSRLLREIPHRLVLPPNTPLKSILEDIQRHCVVSPCSSPLVHERKI